MVNTGQVVTVDLKPAHKTGTYPGLNTSLLQGTIHTHSHQRAVLCCQFSSQHAFRRWVEARKFRTNPHSNRTNSKLYRMELCHWTLASLRRLYMKSNHTPLCHWCKLLFFPDNERSWFYWILHQHLSVPHDKVFIPNTSTLGESISRTHMHQCCDLYGLFFICSMVIKIHPLEAACTLAVMIWKNCYGISPFHSKTTAQ